MNVLWEDKTKKNIFIPAQLKCLVIIEYNIKKLKILINSCEHPAIKYSVLVQQAKLEKTYELIDAESLENHICVYPYSENSQLWLIFLSKDKWADEFAGATDEDDEQLMLNNLNNNNFNNEIDLVDFD